MAKLTLMVGISASGKSTKAKELQELNTNTVIINRDKLREMIYGYSEENISEYYSKENLYILEKQITEYQDYLISNSLSNGRDVIIDNTNLKLKYIKEICQKYSDYDIDFCLIECDLNIAIERDKRRIRTVGEEVIRQQFQNLNILKKNFNFKKIAHTAISKIQQNIDLPKCFVFDVDGTLALKGDRNAFDYSRVLEDTISEPVLECLNSLKSHYTIIICSGREATDECFVKTKEWLKNNNIEYQQLLMRKKGDHRSDFRVKEEMWHDICKEYYISAMFDDRNQVVNHARNLGFKVFQVNEGNF